MLCSTKYFDITHMKGTAMDSERPAARILLAIAVVLAIIADQLLNVSPWGANVPLFGLLFLAGTAAAARLLKQTMPLESWFIGALGVLSTAWLAVRDSPELAVLNSFAALGAFMLVAARRTPGQLSAMTFVDHLVHAATQAYYAVTGLPVLIFSDLKEEAASARERRWDWREVGTGVALAVPALLVFGGLLISADAAFEALVQRLLPDNIWTIIGHTMLIAFFCWVFAGYLRGRFVAPEFVVKNILHTRPFSLGILGIGILLGAVDLLFGLFVGVQIPYFFGGHATVLSTPSLTYAEYARRGFFQLMVVALLSLPLLLGSEWVLRKEKPTEARLFTGLALAMISLLGVMLASAMFKLSLYMGVYGLTIARIQAAAIMVWIAVTLVMFCLTVLRGRRERLPFAMIVAGFAVLTLLNAMDPEAVVAEVNMRRLASDKKFDPGYTLHLSADAAPRLLESISSMDTTHQRILSTRLLIGYEAEKGRFDLRSANYSRSVAAGKVGENLDMLRAMAK